MSRFSLPWRERKRASPPRRPLAPPLHRPPQTLSHVLHLPGRLSYHSPEAREPSQFIPLTAQATSRSSATRKGMLLLRSREPNRCVAKVPLEVHSKILIGARSPVSMVVVPRHQYPEPPHPSLAGPISISCHLAHPLLAVRVRSSPDSASCQHPCKRTHLGVF